MIALQTPAKVSRETLEDRYEGLMYVGVNPSKLQERQWRLIQALLVGVARHTPDDNGLWGGRDIESEIGHAIRETLVRLVDETGTARS